MDYIEAFKNLKANNKYSRKSPHKAILMLTVIELYEHNILTDNEIFYDEKLKSMFLKVWNRVLPNEPLFYTDAYLPFWYLQNDSFWHIVPVRGKEDILSLMRDTNIKPSETKLYDCVKYAELDDDLYFLMTLPSGRSSLKRVLLETYTNLPTGQIDKMTESVDNAIDYSTSAISDYKKIISNEKNETKANAVDVDEDTLHSFNELSEDLQIILNYEYYSFLKKHRSEREMFKEVCPTVFDLYHNIANHPIRKDGIAPSVAFIYDDFLSDLKIALMSENGSMELIDKIDIAISILRGDIVEDNSSEAAEEEIDTTDEIEGQEAAPIYNSGYDDHSLDVEHVYLDSSYNIVKTVTTSSLQDSQEKEEITESRKGKSWTQEEEERITHYFERGISTADIAERVGRTEVAIKARLAKLGLIEYTYGKDEPNEITPNVVPVNPNDFQIENDFSKAIILNKHGEKVYSTDGKLKSIGGKIYRLNLKKECFTIKDMQYNGQVWMKGIKKIVAYPWTGLYRIMDDADDYSEVIEDLFDDPSFEECKIKVKGVWYDNQGDLITDSSIRDDATEESPQKRHDYLKIIKHPLYAVRKQALLRAMGYFRLPAKIRDIARTISRTAWGAPIIEDDVEDIISTLKDVESSDGKYILRKK